MTKTGIILNNEMADFSIPGVQTVAGSGPPKVRIRMLFILKALYFSICVDRIDLKVVSVRQSVSHLLIHK